MVYPIVLNDKQDVMRLNNVACQQIFDMSVSTDSTIVDAKSLLALFTLIGKPNIHLVAPDDINPRYFSKLIKRMGF